MKKKTILLLTIFASIGATHAADPVSQPDRSQLFSDMLRDTNTSARLSPQEEREHTVRVRRLQALENKKTQPVVQESAGAARVQQESRSDQRAASGSMTGAEGDFGRDAGSTLGQSSDSTERLIEAVEQLQVEIRGLRDDLTERRDRSSGGTEVRDRAQDPREPIQSFSEPVATERAPRLR